MFEYTPIFIVAAALLFAFGTKILVQYQTRRKGLRASSTRIKGRPPGQILLSQLDALNLEISIQAASLFAVPVAIYAGYLSFLYFGHHPIGRIDGMVVAAVIGLFFVYMLTKLFVLLRKRQRVRLGYDGQMVVGQALNRLMLKGYRVYHDFPAEDFIIDHIVVGEKGVFAVETKTRSERTTQNPLQDATVEYDGRALHFPSGTDIEMIAQAKRRGKWLSIWLSRAVDEDIPVRAILALPGWLVKRTSNEGLPIVNPKQFDSLFRHIQPRPLTDKMIARINHELEQKCGDISPDFSKEE